MHECMYISTLADPDFQEGENISDKILKLHPTIFCFESLAKNVSYLSAKIFDDPFLFFLVIDHFFGIFTSAAHAGEKPAHFTQLSSEIPVLIIFTPVVLL